VVTINDLFGYVFLALSPVIDTLSDENENENEIHVEELLKLGQRITFSKRPAPNPGEVGLAPPQPPVEPLSSSQIEAGLESDRQNLKSVAVNPNNPGYSSVENYSPYKNQVLTDYTKRNHWLDREHRKHRDPVLPWGSADPFLHNNPGSGGDNAELRVQKNQRDRGLALAQHQVGYRRS